MHPATPCPVRPAHDGDPGSSRPAPSPGTPAGLAPLGPPECHGGPRGLLGPDAVRQRAVREYDALRGAWEDLVAVHPPARPLGESVARHEAGPDGCPSARAKEGHLLQPPVQAVARRAVAGDPHFGRAFLTTDPVACFARDHAAAREVALRTAMAGHAPLTLDGRRRDGGGEGYGEWADGRLEHLDPEAVVVDVLCHR
ncbi:hypothetical protein L0F81_35600 [Streptomyces tricolor]|uniref:Uncharacterized protein n=1 Tax=Streptomyces tricolor TaxID=68277 RepID=A0ABS9JSI9_9ACTN|nr:hypothetical protein [Streptomyces tricolor]MCE0447722.1 hypothetical protein [Streptomyces tricolor]MCG0068530.1 hypothetical protein [Streptomyces tricolor]